MLRRCALALVASILAVGGAGGCARLWPPWPFAGEPWEIARTTRFVAYTKGGGPPATLEALERSYALLESSLFTDRPITPVEVLLLDWPDFRAVFGLHRTGASIAELPGKGAYGRRGLLVMYRQDATTAGAVHRLTHLLLHASAPRAPLWLHEGLASYAEAVEYRDDEKDPVACLGQLPPRDVPIPLDDLFSWSWSAFDESGRWSAYRFTAASLVDYLMTGEGGKLRGKVPDLIARLGEGATTEAALEKVYPALARGPLEQMIRDHREASETTGRGPCPIPYPIKPEPFATSAQARTEPTSKEDLEAMFLRLRMLPRRDGRVDWYPPDMIGVEGGQFPPAVAP